MKVTAWQSPPQNPTLGTDGLHLWKVDLSSVELPNVLDRQEIQRANRLVIPEKRQQFTQARNVLRHILSRYLDQDPSELVFAYGADGKPYLTTKPLHFNLSHSKTWAVVAISLAGSVGVDLEFTAKETSPKSLVDRYFDQAEKLLFSTCSPARQNRQFYRLWTRKESLLKLSGCGWRGLACQPVEDVVSRHFIIAKHFLSCTSFPSGIASIKRYQYP